MLNKTKIDQNKFTNRIAYLIATKRNSLRRLAIKGSTLENQRQLALQKTKTNTNTTEKLFKLKRHHRKHHQNQIDDVCEPSTSGVFPMQRKKVKPIVYGKQSNIF